MGNLVATAQARECGGVYIAQQPVQDGARVVEVVALDVGKATVTRRHQHRNTPCPRGFTNEDLDVQRIAFLHNDIQALEEPVDRVGGDARCHYLYVDVRIDFCDPSSRDNSFVQSEVQHRRGYPIEILQLQI